MTEKNVIQTVHDTLWDVMKADERVLVLGEDVGARGGVFRATAGFLDEFGERRVVDTPLAESGIVGTAIGMAMHGLLPVAEIQFADFIHPAFDQLVSEAARIRYRSAGDWSCPMVVRAPWGGGVHGALYHSQSIEAFYGHVPGLKVVVPSTPYDVKGMLLQAIDDPDPVLFLEHKKTYRLIKGDVPDEPYRVPLGVADVKREGSDLTVIAYGLMLHQALEAAERLQEEEGASAEILDVRTINPLDRETILSSVAKTSKALVDLRGQPHLRRRRRDLGNHLRGAAAGPRRTGQAHRRSGRTGHAVLDPPRALLPARHRARVPGHARPGSVLGRRLDQRVRPFSVGGDQGRVRTGIALPAHGQDLVAAAPPGQGSEDLVAIARPHRGRLPHPEEALLRPVPDQQRREPQHADLQPDPGRVAGQRHPHPRRLAVTGPADGVAHVLGVDREVGDQDVRKERDPQRERPLAAEHRQQDLQMPFPLADQLRE